jgi:hypothetical protein
VQIDKSIRASLKHDHAKRRSAEVLLRLQVLVHRHQGVEQTACSSQEFSVGYAGPPKTTYGFDLVA